MVTAFVVSYLALSMLSSIVYMCACIAGSDTQHELSAPIQ